MLQNAVIDVAIGLILMYLMLSLLCTVVNEYIATKFNLRANALEAAIKKLLDNDKLRTDFYNHGLIVGTKRTVATGTQSVADAVTDAASATKQGVVRLASAVFPAPAGGAAAAVAPAGGAAATDAGDHPSYLSGHTVALALIGSLTPGTVPVIADIRHAVDALPPNSKIREVLLSCLTEAQNDIGVLQKSIATTFDDAMDRLTGAYKRHIKLISMLVGLAVAIAFNADSFNVAITLWKDPTRRAAAVAAAERVAKEPAPTTGQQPPATGQQPPATGQQPPATGQQPPATGQQTPATAQRSVEKQLRDQVETTESSLRSLPIGWSCAVEQQTAASATTPKADMSWEDTAKQFWECAHKQKISVLQILGWLLTAAALSLGAPFWFDLLNLFINLRGAGSKPQRADATKTS
jgi:hypothetical protein